MLESLLDNEYGMGSISRIDKENHYIEATFSNVKNERIVKIIRYMIPDDFAEDNFAICINVHNLLPLLRLSAFQDKRTEIEIAEAENNGRAEWIKQFCMERGIKNLVHFTRLENLESILEHGLLPRNKLELWPKQKRPVFNDEIRYDQCLNATCVSISFPNYKMFYKYRKQNSAKWAVLLLKPDVLWELDCAFSKDNAARGDESRKPLAERRKLVSLYSMFEYSRKVQEALLDIPGSYTTNPQAEALVLDSIPVESIMEVHLESDDDVENLIKKYGTSKIIIKRDVKFFQPREDYLHWQNNGKQVHDDFPFERGDTLGLDFYNNFPDDHVPF